VKKKKKDPDPPTKKDDPPTPQPTPPDPKEEEKRKREERRKKAKEDIEKAKKEWDKEDPPIIEYLKKDALRVTMKESAPIIAKGFGIAAKVLKFIPGMQGVAKGYEAISETAEGAELIYDFVTEMKQSEVMEKGSKELIKRTKPAKQVADRLLKKKFGDKIPEPVRKKIAEEMENLFEKYLADPAAKKLREEMEKNDTDKDLDKPLIDKLKKFMMPTPALQ